MTVQHIEFLKGSALPASHCPIPRTDPRQDHSHTLYLWEPEDDGALRYRCSNCYANVTFETWEARAARFKLAKVDSWLPQQGAKEWRAAA